MPISTSIYMSPIRDRESEGQSAGVVREVACHAGQEYPNLGGAESRLLVGIVLRR